MVLKNCSNPGLYRSRNYFFDQTEAHCALSALDSAHGPRGFNKKTGILRQLFSGQNRLSRPAPAARKYCPGASRLFLLCVGIAMPHSCPPPPWSVPLLLLRAVGRQSQFRHGPAASLTTAANSSAAGSEQRAHRGSEPGARSAAVGSLPVLGSLLINLGQVINLDQVITSSPLQRRSV